MSSFTLLMMEMVQNYEIVVLEALTFAANEVLGSQLNVQSLR